MPTDDTQTSKHLDTSAPEPIGPMYPSKRHEYVSTWEEKIDLPPNEMKKHKQFGVSKSDIGLAVSQYRPGDNLRASDEEPPYYVLITTYISYLMLIVLGHIRDFFGKRFLPEAYAHLTEQNGYAPLNSDFDNFYTRRLKLRINDNFNRPTTGVPGRTVDLLERVSPDRNYSFYLTGFLKNTLNLSSYNYLGFAQSEGPCADAVEKTIKQYGITSCSTRAEVGTLDLHKKVESLVARFVGKEDAMVISMGFATNSTTLPVLVSKGCLIISDELNHSSIRFGSRLSGAFVRMFKHNDMKDLEKLLREVISQGQPRTHRPWKKILVVVEGLYSMEGTICNLPGLVELRRKYKFYLYVDEAHSIGALGPHGRGVCDYFGIDPAQVDICMGTFTKSFGAAGGYIAADKSIIDVLRTTNHGQLYSEPMSPVVLQQIDTSMSIIMGEDGTELGKLHLRRLAFNCRYLANGLRQLGFIVYGHQDSPIVPLLIFQPGKMHRFSIDMLERNIAVVVVGYPATPLISSRARFCVSAAHTKEDLDRVLYHVNEVGEALGLKISSGKKHTMEEVMKLGDTLFADDAKRLAEREAEEKAAVTTTKANGFKYSNGSIEKTKADVTIHAVPTRLATATNGHANANGHGNVHGNANGTVFSTPIAV